MPQDCFEKRLTGVSRSAFALGSKQQKKNFAATLCKDTKLDLQIIVGVILQQWGWRGWCQEELTLWEAQGPVHNL